MGYRSGRKHSSSLRKVQKRLIPQRGQISVMRLRMVRIAQMEGTYKHVNCKCRPDAVFCSCQAAPFALIFKRPRRVHSTSIFNWLHPPAGHLYTLTPVVYPSHPRTRERRWVAPLRTSSIPPFLSLVSCCVPFLSTGTSKVSASILLGDARVLRTHRTAWNAGTCLYMAWTGLGCLMQCINSIVWNKT
jgi:hypothetical protein